MSVTRESKHSGLKHQRTHNGGSDGMAWRYVRQPNGLFARFSEVVDNFTHYNCTAEETLGLSNGLRLNDREAAKKIARAVDSPCLRRFEEAMEIVEDAHGSAEAFRVRSELSKPAE